MDTYMTSPQMDVDVCYSSFNGFSIKKVPVIRIFGATPVGQKCCLHLHKTFPYFFIRIDETESLNQIDDYLRRLSISIERAMQVALGTRANKEDQYVHSISLVKGKPFYGFYGGAILFLRVFIYDPQHLTRMVNLLRSGAIMGKQFDIFEAHIPYLLQVCIDYGLYGMDLVHFSSVQFRQPLPNKMKRAWRNITSPSENNSDSEGFKLANKEKLIFDTQRSCNKVWIAGTVPAGWTNSVKRTSHCELELDACAEDITNIVSFTDTPHLSSDPRREMLVKSLAEIWREERARHKGGSDSFLTPADSEQQNLQNDAWGIHSPSSNEQSLLQQLQEIIITDAKRATEAEKQASLSENQESEVDKLSGSSIRGSPLIYSSPPANLSYGKLEKYYHRAGNSRNSQAVPSQYEPIVNEQIVLSQQSDLEVFNILNDMIDEEIEEDNDEAGNSQQELSDLIEASKMVPEGIIEEEIPTENQPKPGVPYPIDDIEELVQLSQSPIPQLDGSDDGFEPPPRKYRKKKDLRKRYCPLFEEDPLRSPPRKRHRRHSTKYESTSTYSRSRYLDPGPPTLYNFPPPSKKQPSTANVLDYKNLLDNTRKEDEVVLVPATPANQTSQITQSSMSTMYSYLNPAEINYPLPPLYPGVSEEKVAAEALIEEQKKFNLVKPTLAFVPKPLKPIKTSPVATPTQSPGVVIPLGMWSPESTQHPFYFPKQPTSLDPTSLDTTSLVNTHLDMSAEDLGRPVVQLIQSPQKFTPFSFSEDKEIAEEEIPVLQIHPNPPSPSPASPSQPMAPMEEISENKAEAVQPINDEFSEIIEIAPLPQQEFSEILVESPMLKPLPAPHLAEQLEQINEFAVDANTTELIAVRLKRKAPSREEIVNGFAKYQLPSVIYKPPFYETASELPHKPRVFAGVTFKIPVNDINSLPPFAPVLPDNTTVSFSDKGIEYWKNIERNLATIEKKPPKLIATTLLRDPPSRKAVIQWLNNAANEETTKVSNASQLDGPTPNPKDPYGFLCISNEILSSRVQNINQHLSVMSIEVHARTRGGFKPNPIIDSIYLISYCIKDDSAIFNNQDPDQTEIDESKINYTFESGIILIDDHDKTGNLQRSPEGAKLTKVKDENELLDAFVELVRYKDPDIFAGYEIQSGSLGYVIERATKLNRNMCSELSRVSYGNESNDIKSDAWGVTHGNGIKITGRIILNVWRILRSEVKANIYTFENMAYHVLHQRKPFYNHEILTKWLLGVPVASSAGTTNTYTAATTFWLALHYYTDRSKSNILLLDQLDVIGRTSELARLYGIDFYSVLSRGSQYRVESMTLRLTRPQNFVLLSPSRAQVNGMNAPECLPLVMEPESQFYTNPVLVLDFQSLYPSIIIAYNYCYSTCLGKMGKDHSNKKLGCSSLHLPAGLLKILGMNNIIVSPNEIMYVHSKVRTGILPRLLQEILNTRVMVKKAMSKAKNNTSLLKLLDARQYGLKMIANVTYGYTSASFSGRMPCVEIADSIVQTARETLERAIRYVEATWKGAKVVYGDTDSLFVELPGASKVEAFLVGNQIAEQVTNMNPYPVKLKFEKVYLPCLLVSKKRYVGYMYESVHQTEPVFDAKGIETVRRDSCLLVSKIMEKSVRMLFETKNLSLIRSYLCKQWTKILQSRVSVGDYIFAKEVRLGTYSTKVPPPPAALVCLKRMAIDPKAEPQYAERIPYIVVYGNPSSRLCDLVIDPQELFTSNTDLRVHSMYYIQKQIIPALSRLFNLIGVDVKSWFLDMPQKSRLPINRTVGITNQKKKSRIDQYYVSSRCLVCDQITATPICNNCKKDSQFTVLVLLNRLKSTQQQHQRLLTICEQCSFTSAPNIKCISLDCPVYFERMKFSLLSADMLHVKNEIENL